jgi:hypothetical protein
MSDRSDPFLTVNVQSGQCFKIGATVPSILEAFAFGLYGLCLVHRQPRKLAHGDGATRSRNCTVPMILGEVLTVLDWSDIERNSHIDPRYRTGSSELTHGPYPSLPQTAPVRHFAITMTPVTGAQFNIELLDPTLSFSMSLLLHLLLLP